jgi:hypothetical protein
MVDEERTKNDQDQPKRNLNVRIEGALTLNHRSESTNQEKGPNPATERTEHFAAWQWIVAFVKDTNAVMATATVVIAIFTIVLAKQGCRQQDILVATERPEIIVNIATMSQINGEWHVSFPYKNSGHWVARYIAIHASGHFGPLLSLESMPTLRENPDCSGSDNDTLPLGSQDGYQWSLTLSPQPTQQQLDGMRKGTLTLYLTGCIGYKDDIDRSYASPICQFYFPNPTNALNSFGFCLLDRNVPKSAPTH